MADEATIRKLDGILQEKLKQIEGNTKVRDKNNEAIQ